MIPLAFVLTFHLSLSRAPQASASGGSAPPALDGYALATQGPSSQAADPWFAPDKAKHFFMGAFVQSLGYGGLRAIGLKNGAALAGASLATTAVCLGKELYDRGGRGDPSVRDFTWGLVGGGAATLLLVRTQR